MTDSHHDPIQTLLPLEEVWTPDRLDLTSYGAGEILLDRSTPNPPVTLHVHIEWKDWVVGTLIHGTQCCVLGHIALSAGVTRSSLRDSFSLPSLPQAERSKLPDFLVDVDSWREPAVMRSLLAAINDDATQHPGWRAEVLTRLLATKGIRLTWGEPDPQVWAGFWRPRPPTPFSTSPSTDSNKETP